MLVPTCARADLKYQCSKMRTVSRTRVKVFGSMVDILSVEDINFKPTEILK